MGDSAKSAEETYLAYKECLAQNNRPRAGLNLMVAAIMGYLPAQAELGYKYLNGILFPKDYTQAMRWLSAAAEKEDTDSVVNLAIMYMYGYGTKTDGPKAVSHLEKAIAADYPAAGRFMGLCFEKGIGAEKNFEKAAEWYRWAAEKGDAGAACLLGDAYENGRGVSADKAEAVRWYETAAAADCEEAATAKEALARLKGNVQSRA
ncbi:MAG: sel1 repeat family protein [Lachnospiraceae bacterium]|nr:sel1 repeat family protein [Lachnospiraceae bacterium]